MEAELAGTHQEIVWAPVSAQSYELLNEADLPPPETIEPRRVVAGSRHGPDAALKLFEEHRVEAMAAEAFYGWGAASV